MTTTFTFLHCLILTILTVPAFCQSPPGQVKKSFHALHSLAGTWTMPGKKAVLYESWHKMNDSTLLGRSYQVNGKDTIATEQVELIMRDYSIMYVPTVAENNNKPVIFTLVSSRNGAYTFENKEHDFPQRIIYHLPRNNTMQAWVEGNINGQFKRSTFSYRKIL